MKYIKLIKNINKSQLQFFLMYLVEGNIDNIQLIGVHNTKQLVILKRCLALKHVFAIIVLRPNLQVTVTKFCVDMKM